MSDGPAVAGFAFDPKGLGRWTDEAELLVTTEAVSAYARATNEADPRCLRGELAPPLFAWVPMLTVVRAAIAGLVTFDPTNKVASVQGEHDLFIDRPISVGMRLRSRAVAIGVRGKRSGTTLIFKIATREAGGPAVNSQFLTLFALGLTGIPDVGGAAPDHQLPEGSKTEESSQVVREFVDPDQSYRYAEASGDHSPVHVDRDAARAAGFQGVITHGVCTLAFCARAIVSACGNGDATRLRRVAGRFSRPMLPGQILETRIWPLPGPRGHTGYAFEGADERGAVVVAHGRAELA